MFNLPKSLKQKPPPKQKKEKKEKKGGKVDAGTVRGMGQEFKTVRAFGKEAQMPIGSGETTGERGSKGWSLSGVAVDADTLKRRLKKGKS